jgi:hypothetical protein
MNDDDPTFPVSRITPPVQPHASSRRRQMLPVLAAGGAVLLLGGGVAVWLLWPRPMNPPRGPHLAVAPLAVTPHVVAPPAAPAPASPPTQTLPPERLPEPAQSFRIQTADEATILGHIADGLTAFRFADNPNIIVLDFPSLRMQGEMLNRVASLIEKAGLPRRRVLDDTELDAAIRERGDTMETYYYGHDYRADELAYFFATADRQHTVLDASETQLRALLEQLGWLRPGAVGALISVPRTGAAITEPMRAAMLHHELSHGEFFSVRDYARYVEGFWLHAMTEAERAAVRKFLGSMGYDTDDETLMYNEAQAYLMFTYDPHFFLPSNVNMTPARRLQLQTAFHAGMPDGWLKAALAEHLRSVEK